VGRRKLLPVGALPLVGGSLCLDFVNTTGARASGAARERLKSYGDLLVWSRRAGALDGRSERRLRAVGSKRAAGAVRALRRVCRLREDLYRLFRTIAQGGAPSLDTLKRLSAWWRAERVRRELAIEDGAVVLRVRVQADELDRMLWPIVASAAELLVSPRIARVKRCGECDWLFVDESKNRSRRWCKKVCGDRVRARRHYARSRAVAR
jgi:predicted RNA-binding Zn ribbon-like protein